MRADFNIAGGDFEASTSLNNSDARPAMNAHKT